MRIAQMAPASPRRPRPSVWAVLAAGLPLLAILVGMAAFVQATGQWGVMASRESPGSSPERVVAVMEEYLDRWQPLADPLLRLPGGVQAKSSNVHGVEIDGVRYYYRVRHGPSFDPVSRSAAADHHVVAVLQSGTQWETEIYTLRDSR